MEKALLVAFLGIVKLRDGWLTFLPPGRQLVTRERSKEELVRASLDTTADTEPINFSFYFKDEISEEVKTVMKTIDQMLVNETGKSLDSILEEPPTAAEDHPRKEEIHSQAHRVSVAAKPENIYVNVNVVRSVLDDSKLEETEVM